MRRLEWDTESVVIKKDQLKGLETESGGRLRGQ